MCERLGLACRGSALVVVGRRTAACVTAPGGSVWGAEANSAGLCCWTGCCCCAGFSSADGGAGWGSNDALPLFLRGAGAALGSFGSAGLRVRFVFFSSAFGSFGFGFGPGFLRGWPEAVSLGVVVVVVVDDVATPTPPAGCGVTTRFAEWFGVPCSGEWGGELRLSGELKR